MPAPAGFPEAGATTERNAQADARCQERHKSNMGLNFVGVPMRSHKPEISTGPLHPFDGAPMRPDYYTQQAERLERSAEAQRA